MISKQNFVRESLALNLFFLRIMKEHSIFLEAALPSKNRILISQAEALKNTFTMLLSQAVYLSDGVIDSNLLQANEIVTKHTLHAEKKTQFLSGIMIDSRITFLENSLKPCTGNEDISRLTGPVYMLNQRSLAAVHMIIQFKTKLKNEVLACRLFTTVYPSLIDHILREAEHFSKSLLKLQKGMEIHRKEDLNEEEAFWDEIMSEHSFFIRGLLDPEETELFNIADNFGKEFEDLREKAAALNKSELAPSGLTANTLNSAKKLRDFKEQGTEGILDCKIKSMIIPLLGDHVLREANHYINILESYS